MDYRLTISIGHNPTVPETRLIEDLTETFGVKPVITKLPITPEIEKAMEDAVGGKNTTFKIIISAPTFEAAVFNLLIQLENLGYDWQFRRPMKILDDKYTFIATLLPERGKFYKPDLRSITAILDESLW